MNRIILLGAPGSGKGTQAERICNKYNIPAVSTGNILREAIAAGTETGLAAKEYMDRGDLVPDKVVVGVLKDRLSKPDCAGGFLLDGFPRNIAQAETLEKFGIDIDKVIEIDVPDAEILKRMSGRRVCPKCGASYHLEFKPSANGGRCDKCGVDIVIREDDKPETVAARLKTYHNRTEPLSAFYTKRGLAKKREILTKVSGVGDIDDVTFRVMDAIGL
ncbi:adenylate kinase [Clostridia bacterium]|nr:adenylate kinase [Clostridia bacterium]